MRVFGIVLPPGIEIYYNRAIKMYDISVHCNVGRNHHFFSRGRKLKLKEFTKMFDVAYAWSFLSEPEKQGWGSAGDVDGQVGYNLFFQDKVYRLVNGISGNATASDHHQFKVGNINIPEGNNSAIIRQQFLRTFYHPAEFGLSWKTNLTADGPNPYVKLKFTYLYWHTGGTYEQTDEINIGLNDSWKTELKSITRKTGTTASAEITLELNDVKGDIWFDNFLFMYYGVNQTKDRACNEVQNFWQKVDMPAGNTFRSIYPTGAAL